MIYKHFTTKERILLEQHKKDNLPIKQIAANLNRHISSIYREFKRNTNINNESVYNFESAEQNYLKKRYKKPIKLNVELQQHIEEKFNETWSPEQISNKRMVYLLFCHVLKQFTIDYIVVY